MLLLRVSPPLLSYCKRGKRCLAKADTVKVNAYYGGRNLITGMQNRGASREGKADYTGTIFLWIETVYLSINPKAQKFDIPNKV